MSVLHGHETAATTRPPRPRWGFEQTTVPRYGVAYHRLILLAPGSTRRDYRLLRLHQDVPWLALLATIGVLLLLTPVLGDVGAFVTAAVICAGSIGVSAHCTWAIRRQAVQIDTCTGLDLAPLPSRAARLVQLHALAQLRSAEQDLRAGSLDPAQFEAVWHDVYEDARPFDTRRRAHDRRS